MPDGIGALASDLKMRSHSAPPTGRGFCATARFRVVAPDFFRNGDSPVEMEDFFMR